MQQRIRDLDTLACLLESHCARVLSATLDPDGFVAFSVDVIDPAQAEHIAAALARREHSVNARSFCAVQRELRRHMSEARRQAVQR